MMKNCLAFLLILISFAAFSQDFEIIKYPDVGVTDGKMMTSDLNVDGYLDLLISGTINDGNEITWIYTVDTTYGLFKSQELPGFEYPDLALSDLNNDGYNDILISGLVGGEPTFSVNRNESDFKFTVVENWPNFIGIVKTADLDNNGKVEILASGFDRNNDILNNIWIQDTEGFKLNDSEQFESAGDFEILDYNGDNFSDILVGTGEPGGIVSFQILKNNGWASFSSIAQNFKGYINPKISKGDFSQNGEMDLLICGERDSGYFVDLYTNESGNFTLDQTIQLDEAILDIISVDITNDGRMDGIVLTANAVILLKGGPNSFEEIVLLDSLTEGSIAIGDFDRDYDQDLFVSGNRDDINNIWVFKNNSPENGRPSFPRIENMYQTEEGFYIKWEPATDDTTPQQSISYRVVIRDGSTLVNATNWTISDYGFMGLGNEYIYHGLPLGNYSINITALDNSLITEFEYPFDDPSSSMCNSNPYSCDSLITKLIVKCKEKPLDPIVFPGGHEVYWYTLEDSLGFGSVLPDFQPVNNDVIRANFTDDNGCTLFYRLRIKVIDPQIYDPGLMDSIDKCIGASLFEEDLNLNASPNLIPIWRSSANGSRLVFPITVERDFNIVLELSDTNKCTFYDTIQIKAHPIPIINAGEDKAVVLGESVQLEANGADLYSWDPPIYLSDPTIPNPICTPDKQIMYTVTGFQGICSNQDQITVSVIKGIFIPNLFSPNGDPNNAIFRVMGDGIKALTLRIYTNSGSKIFESSNFREGWDGTSNGKPMPPGVYHWSITGKYLNDQDISFRGRNSGLVTLVR